MINIYELDEHEELKDISIYSYYDNTDLLPNGYTKVAETSYKNGFQKQKLMN